MIRQQLGFGSVGLLKPAEPMFLAVMNVLVRAGVGALR
jgi:hypothetical protein